MTSRMRSAMELAAGGGRMLLDVAFPPRCPSCRAPVAGVHQFCVECFARLRMISAPMCECCGIPFAVALVAGGKCPECLDEPPSFARARAVMVYDAVSAPLITSLKFNDQWMGLRHYAAMMAASGGALLQEAEMIVPVPLNWRRFWARKYNQAALLAYALARQSGVACVPDALRRARATTPQMRLARAERKENVKGAFAVSRRRLRRVAGKHILLVDDVVTTGATVEACAQALLKAGARQVDVIALARTVKE